MDTPYILRPHLELGDICRIVSDGRGDLLGLEQRLGLVLGGVLLGLEHSFGLVIGGVEGQVVDLLVEGRRIKLNRRWLEPLAREHVRPAGGVV